MFDFMDEIVEAVSGFTQEAAELAAGFILFLLKAVIAITAPVWLLPYMFIRDLARDNNGGKCENPDCGRCPFPPCEKGEAGNE